MKYRKEKLRKKEGEGFSRSSTQIVDGNYDKAFTRILDQIKYTT